MPEQLTQVFVNLVTNACHAVAATGGTITITTRALADARVRVVVHDDGHGIDAGHLDHVFAPFFTTKGDGRGTGLGLSIVKNIVSHHGGTIAAESSPSFGTSFTLELPVGR
jgi:signal transduction histidine kinase